MRLILLLTMALIAGCSPARRGDARLTTIVALIGRQGDRNLAVEFPKFRIDTPREYRWRARGLPPADFSYTLNLGLPRLDAFTGNREAAAVRQPAWRELEIKG